MSKALLICFLSIVIIGCNTEAKKEGKSSDENNELDEAMSDLDKLAISQNELYSEPEEEIVNLEVTEDEVFFTPPEFNIKITSESPTSVEDGIEDYVTIDLNVTVTNDQLFTPLNYVIKDQSKDATFKSGNNPFFNQGPYDNFAGGWIEFRTNYRLPYYVEFEYKLEQEKEGKLHVDTLIFSEYIEPEIINSLDKLFNNK